MNLPGFSVRRPVFTTMVTLIILVVGSVALSRLQIDMLPDVEMPTLMIRTDYEGAGPEIMERLVTRIIEEIVSTVSGVADMTSTSSEGRSNISLSFVWGTDINMAALDVRAVIEDEINELPDDVVRPRIRKFDVNSFPVVILGITGRLDPVELTQLIEDQVRYRFARIPGVAQVDLWGGFTREVRVELFPDRIKALGLPLDHIIQALRDANLDEPTGRLDQGRYSVVLRAPAEYTDLDQIRDTIVFQQPGGAVRLGQIAEVKETYEKRTRIIRVNGEQGIRVAIRKESNANTVEVSKLILAQIDEINAALPQIHVVPVTNQGNFIERSIRNVAKSVMVGSGLAVLVLLFFLRTVRSTLVISLSIPISMVATFALMFFGKFTLNLMTLGGLALGAGMMVDSSIVVLENIFRRKSENNETPEQASVAGATEMGPAILAGTATTLVIFLPLIFVRGVSGILFTEMAYVIIFSLICALLVSLSLVPMLTSKLLAFKPAYGRAPSSELDRLFNLSGVLFDRLVSGYTRILAQVLNHPKTTVVLSFALLAASLVLVPEIGTELLPPSDEGEVQISGKMEQGTRLELVDRQARLMEALVYPAVPEAVSSVISLGASGRNPGETARAQISISLVPSSFRERSNEEIAADLRGRLAGKIPGMEIRTRAPQGQFLLDRILGSDEGITVDVRGRDLSVLDSLSRKVAEVVRNVPGITDVEISREDGIPQQEIMVDRDKAADLGFSVKDITGMLSTAVVGTKAGEYRTGGDSCRILVQLKDAEKRPMSELLDLIPAVYSLFHPEKQEPAP